MKKLDENGLQMPESLGRAERSMEALQRLSALKVRVMRGGREESIEARDLVPGDVLLIAGKGHEDYQIVGTTKHHFSDHEVVLETLKRK